MTKRSFRFGAIALLAVLAPGALLYPSPSQASSGRAPDSVWSLLPKYYYPAHTGVVALDPTNDTLDSVLGPLHRHTYEQLGRIEDSGWFQIGTLVAKTRRTIHGKKRTTSHKLLWVYGVSYYASPPQAAEAVDDTISPLPAVAGLGSIGRLLTTSGGGYYFTLSGFSTGSIVVEQFCAEKAGDRKLFGKELQRYCTKQRTFLAQILSQLSVPTATASPTAAASGTPTAVPTTSSSGRGALGRRVDRAARSAPGMPIAPGQAVPSTKG